MPIKNKIDIKRYATGTILNIVAIIILARGESVDVIAIFFCCLVLNQFFLILFGMKLLQTDEFKTYIPTPLLIVLKLFVLAFAFYYAYLHAQELLFFLVFSYIFQLIILTISTKRIIKKN